MPRETFQQKAARLVAAGRVSLCGPFAIVIGDHGTYELSWQGMEWQCPCGSRRRRCSHVLAVEVVRAQRVGTERHEREREIEQEEQPMSDYDRYGGDRNGAAAQDEQRAPTIFSVERAIKSQKKARLSIAGSAKSGKTLTALKIATGIVGPAGRKAVIDTEEHSAAMFADKYQFDVLQMPDHSPATFAAAIEYLGEQGYECIIIDSLSHAWFGDKGSLELHDLGTEKERGNSFAGWKHVRPHERRMVQAILTSPAHVIVTMRTDTEWVVEDKKPIKVGTKPVQKAGIEYEFDMNAEMTAEHTLIVSGSRLECLDGKIFALPDESVGRAIRDELLRGVAVAPATPQVPGQATSSSPPAAAPAPAWQWNPAVRGKAHAKMLRLGISPDAAEEKLAAVTSQPMMDLLSKELTAEDRGQKAAGTVGVWAPPGKEQPPAAEAVAAVPEATEAPATAPVAPPPTATANTPVEAPTVAPPTPAAPAEPEGDEAVSDDPFADGAGEGEEGGIGTSLFGNSADVAALLESATKMVKADAVPPALMMAAANSEVLQALITADLGISAADQEALLLELGRGAWEDLGREERLTLYWMAQERAEKGE